MSRLDFHFELHDKVPHLESNLAAEAETRLRELAEGQTDMIGASVAVRELMKGNLYARKECPPPIERSSGAGVADFQDTYPARLHRPGWKSARNSNLVSPWEKLSFNGRFRA